MSARRPMDFNELPLRRVPTTPVLPSPRVTSRPHSVSLAATMSDVRVFLEAELGMGMDVAADGGDLALDLERTRQNRHWVLRLERSGILAQSDTMLSLQEVEDAAQVVYAAMPPTAQYAWPLLARRTGCEVWVKHENHTPIGAFKVRGGLVYMDG